MAKFKSKNGETMVWLSKSEVMIEFQNGYSQVSNEKLVKEMQANGYIPVGTISKTSTTKSSNKKE